MLVFTKKLQKNPSEPSSAQAYTYRTVKEKTGERKSDEKKGSQRNQRFQTRTCGLRCFFLILSCALHPSLLSPLKLVRLGIHTKGSIKKKTVWGEASAVWRFLLTCTYSNSVQTAKGGIIMFFSRSSPWEALTNPCLPSPAATNQSTFFLPPFFATDKVEQWHPRRKDHIWMSTVTYWRRHKWHSNFVGVIKTRIISAWSRSDKRNKSHGNFNHDPGDYDRKLNGVDLNLPGKQNEHNSWEMHEK